jgi:hypothetical protein
LGRDILPHIAADMIPLGAGVNDSRHWTAAIHISNK